MASVQVCVCEGACMWRSEVTSVTVPLEHSTLLFETGSLTGTRLPQWVRLAEQYQGPSVPPTLALGLQVWASGSEFCLFIFNMGSGAQAQDFTLARPALYELGHPPPGPGV